nr:hypothetical protein [Tanacetum cinerariifolium]
ELENVFYANIVTFDIAMLPEAKPDDLQIRVWKNVFTKDGSAKLNDAALPAVMEMNRNAVGYLRCSYA